MATKGKKLLLVGDNPFHGINHLSDDRARARGNEVSQSEYAGKLVMTSVENGADGFMFSVSETTLSTLRVIRENIDGQSVSLYAIIPYAYEYVRLATHLGMVGLAKNVAKQIAFSGNVKAAAAGLKCVATMDPKDLLKAYLLYEVHRIKSAAGRKLNLESVMLHEVITEMVISLNLDWLAKLYIEYALDIGVTPGFETRNFAYLVNKFSGWGIDFKEIAIAAPFNGVGFQMNPSKEACEDALSQIPESNVIAMSILASGYLKPIEAAKYVEGLPNLRGMVVGVSKEHHARDTFNLLRENC